MIKKLLIVEACVNFEKDFIHTPELETICFGNYQIIGSKEYVKFAQEHSSIAISFDYTGVFSEETTCVIHVFKNTIEITTDCLGVSPVFFSYNNKENLIISDSLWNCSRIAGKKEINHKAIAEQLFFGYIWSDMITVINGVCITRGSSKYVFSKSTFTEQQLKYPFEIDIIPEQVSKKVVQNAEDAFVSLLNKYTMQKELPNVQNPLLLLSGGFDSRVVLQALHSGKQEFDLLSLGYPSSTDVKIAKLLAEKLNHELYRFSFPADWIYDNRRAVIDICNATVNIQTGFLLGSSKYITEARSVYTGLYGDQITGDRLAGYDVLLKKFKNDTFQVIPKAFNWGLNFQELKKAGVGYYEHIQELLSTITLSKSNALTQMYLWDWKKRQLKYNQCVVNLLSTGQSRLNLPFVDKNFISSWSVLSYKHLRNQQLYKKMILKHLGSNLLSVRTEKSLKTNSISDCIFVKKFFSLLNRIRPSFNKPNDLIYIDYDDQLVAQKTKVEKKVNEFFPEQIVGYGSPKLWYLLSVTEIFKAVKKNN